MPKILSKYIISEHLWYSNYFRDNLFNVYNSSSCLPKTLRTVILCSKNNYNGCYCAHTLRESDVSLLIYFFVIYIFSYNRFVPYLISFPFFYVHLTLKGLNVPIYVNSTLSPYQHVSISVLLKLYIIVLIQ